MKEDKRHIQMRLSPALRDELGELAENHKMSISDVVRASLLFGMPVFAAMTDLQRELGQRLVEILKRDSRA